MKTHGLTPAGTFCCAAQRRSMPLSPGPWCAPFVSDQSHDQDLVRPLWPIVFLSFHYPMSHLGPQYSCARGPYVPDIIEATLIELTLDKLTCRGIPAQLARDRRGGPLKLARNRADSMSLNTQDGDLFALGSVRRKVSIVQPTIRRLKTSSTTAK